MFGPEAQLSGIEFQNKETELWHFGATFYPVQKQIKFQTIQRFTALGLSSGGAGYAGCVAWSKALVTVDVLTAQEQAALEEALNELLEEVGPGQTISAQ
ncbi:hypothetical protein ACNKHW_25340 [Shigella flexneri]